VEFVLVEREIDMARKKMFKGRKVRPAWLPSGSVLLWGLVLFQALWLAGFIWSGVHPCRRPGAGGFRSFGSNVPTKVKFRICCWNEAVRGRK
jgi:hypothetical protein